MAEKIKAKLPLADNTFVAWGGKEGQIYPADQTRLQNQGYVVSANWISFVLKLTDNTVIVWGEELLEAAGEELNDVVDIYAGHRDFALKKKDGRLVMFGGGEYSQDTLPKTDVLEIFSNEHAFAATLKKGGVVAWGRNESGFIEPAKAQKMKDQTVVNIYST